jgi:SAM-dependent methyltransferase
MHLTEAVAKYYAALAMEYDRSAGYTEALAGELREPIKARFREALRGHRVLEIACGTGYWTEVIADTAESVLATDVDATMISLARERLARRSNVQCHAADAYALDGVRGQFTAAFSHWWWSHVPKSRVRGFLGVLHDKLVPGALVVFADQLRYDCPHRWEDQEGNLLEERVLPDGSRWEIVKNFPSEEELARELAGIAESVAYREYPGARYWALTYNTRANRQQVA